mmetsp:Transcript_3825/g.5555  ORF Transcript_3825/g.5555 Transcript_3825/m.5555 type:complete len:299 (+) Transcript_3825:154-1050(+)|eukprot:CAMPEP_0203770164 /NCGR_PEP_ID=MMETSP0099_2-20121227/2631_1 /ASSEMBLY_ACC=CAM_ASM_000209 /TAXON_ID=96639 /ORGANISM=" , Strain NY0313808BC1" /LENGTH=298 /DNA_ID=CAMNT_0050667215 /DNA_START=135 /DNA_END=1031 /DNA_ORIENTATION=-
MADDAGKRKCPGEGRGVEDESSKRVKVDIGEEREKVDGEISKRVQTPTGEDKKVADKVDWNERIINNDSRGIRLPLGVWDEEKKLCWVAEERGKRLPRMGLYISSVRWLKPEEIAFLVSEGAIDLVSRETLDGKDTYRILDREGAFSLCYTALGYHNVPLADYFVYVALRKLHFIVFRDICWEKTEETMFEPPDKFEAAAKDNSGAPVNASLSLRFDVYLPRKSFKVNDRGVPDFKVATSRPADRVPPVAMMRDMAKECAEIKTKLRVGLYDGQSVQFIQVEDFQMKHIKQMWDKTDK